MYKKWHLLTLGLAMLIGACDPPQQKPERTKSEAKTTASASSATTSNSAEPTSPPAPVAVPAVSVATAASAAPSVMIEPPKPDPPKFPVPQGIEFVPSDKWRTQNPDFSMLGSMDHSENGPIMDIVVMHAVVLATAENELDKLQQIQYYHMNKINGRGYGDIAVHYMIGPSGKVYEGRALRYRPEATAGSGMGRFGDPWGKCVVMLLGNFNVPEQAFTPEAQNALMTLIEDRKSVFERMFEDALKIREAETRALRGSDGPFGLDQVRIRKHPTLPPVLQNFLDGKDSSPVTVTDGGTGSETAGDGGTGSPSEWSALQCPLSF
jgi:hypothetical protein